MNEYSYNPKRKETVIREYIKKQEQEDRRLDQLNMFE